MSAPRPDTSLWHPFSNMAAVRHAELVFTRAEGNWVWGDDGRRFLDATASLWYANVGHGRREIIDAITAQAGALDAYSTFGDYSNEPAPALAERLAGLAPVDDARVFLGTGGGDGIETAAELARYYWRTVGQPERTHIVTRDKSYHGTHGFGTSMAGIEGNRVGFSELIPGGSRVAWDSAAALEAEIERVGADKVAAFFCEPVIGAGGVYPPPRDYLPRVAEVCARHGVLLVVDSVICGFGRMGSWFGVERWDLRPDMITFAKGVTSGYLPLGGVVVSGRVAEPFWEGDGQAFRHGATCAGHAACSAAAPRQPRPPRPRRPGGAGRSPRGASLRLAGRPPGPPRGERGTWRCRPPRGRGDLPVGPRGSPRCRRRAAPGRSGRRGACPAPRHRGGSVTAAHDRGQRADADRRGDRQGSRPRHLSLIDLTAT